MSPAERETPAGEAMREAVAQWLEYEVGLYVSDAAEKAGEFCGPSGPIASELARLTAERDEARANLVEAGKLLFDAKIANDFQAALIRNITDRATAAEAALTSLRAEHAAEVARKDAEIADLRGALEDTKAAADDLAHACLDERDYKAAGALQFVSGFISDRRSPRQPGAEP